MKANVITLMLLSALCLGAYAQDDDMYSFSSKKAQKKSSATNVQRQSASAYDFDDEAEADYHIGELRDVDEYNRRYTAKTDGTQSYRFSGDTLYVTTAPSEDNAISYKEGYSDGYSDAIYDGDFCLTSRLARYHGFRWNDPFYWDYYYSWYDPWYSWHSPYYYNYIGWNGWGLSWGWHSPYYYHGWDYGWHHPHHYGGYHGGHPTRHQTTASRNLGQRSATYSGRMGGTRQSSGRVGPSRSAASGSSHGTYQSPTRSGNQSSSRSNSGTYQSPSRGTYQSPTRSSSSNNTGTTSRSGSYQSPTRSSGGSYSGGASRSSSGSFGGGGASRGGGGFSGGSRGGGGGGSRGGGRR